MVRLEFFRKATKQFYFNFFNEDHNSFEFFLNNDLNFVNEFKIDYDCDLNF